MPTDDSKNVYDDLAVERPSSSTTSDLARRGSISANGCYRTVVMVSSLSETLSKGGHEGAKGN